MRMGPSACDQAPVRPEQRVGRDDPPVTPGAWQRLCECSEPGKQPVQQAEHPPILCWNGPRPVSRVFGTHRSSRRVTQTASSVIAMPACPPRPTCSCSRWPVPSSPAPATGWPAEWESGRPARIARDQPQPRHPCRGDAIGQLLCLRERDVRLYLWWSHSYRLPAWPNAVDRSP